jgi:homoserine O-succinyltransferase
MCGGVNAMPRAASQARAPVKIGLVNNMGDAALLATERQFMRLIEAASREIDVHVRLFYLPEIARGDAARAQLHARYAPIDALPHAGLDALIVTGCEPVRSNLKDEPYWSSLLRLIDWAKDNTISTIWSCLAAHAAVLHLDGIERQRLPRKLVGIYEFERVSDHPLLRAVTELVHVPHSRLNGLSSSDLARRGYELLTQSADSGVDAFVKQYKSLLVFLQGHPEYEPDSLYREYRRDMTRFLNGQQDTCPALPDNYFDRKTNLLFSAFGEAARAERTRALVRHFPALEKVRLSRADWAASSSRLFSNWICHIAEAKAQQVHLAHEHVIV